MYVVGNVCTPVVVTQTSCTVPSPSPTPVSSAVVNYYAVGGCAGSPANTTTVVSGVCSSRLGPPSMWVSCDVSGGSGVLRVDFGNTSNTGCSSESGSGRDVTVTMNTCYTYPAYAPLTGNNSVMFVRSRHHHHPELAPTLLVKGRERSNY